MKNLLALFLFLSVILVLPTSCKKDSTDDNTTISGDPSPMGTVGTVVQSSSQAVEGVTDINASVTNLTDGVSTYSGKATVTNPVIKNLLSNVPGITIKGDTVTATGFRLKQTVEGVESFVPSGPGVLVKYSSNVGDTYPVGSTGKTRTVVSKSTTDDYSYGFYMIKVMKVEEPNTSKRFASIVKTSYWANHKFGVVAVQWDFSDGTSVKFPIYSSATNGK